MSINSSRRRDREGKEKKELDFRLYLITDRKLFSDTESLYFGVEEALKGGVRAVQLREKEIPVRGLLDMAYRMREITKDYCARLFINDRVDVAMAVQADGVHLGRKSMPVSAAKTASAGRLIVGVSTHSPGEAFEAERDGADFITFGPVYQTPSKLKYGAPVGIGSLKQVCSGISVPVFAIGGITPERLGEIDNSGADGVALISAILGSENIRKTTERFLGHLK